MCYNEVIKFNYFEMIRESKEVLISTVTSSCYVQEYIMTNEMIKVMAYYTNLKKEK